MEHLVREKGHIGKEQGSIKFERESEAHIFKDRLDSFQGTAAFIIEEDPDYFEEAWGLIFLFDNYYYDEVDTEIVCSLIYNGKWDRNSCRHNMRYEGVDLVSFESLKSSMLKGDIL